MTLRGDHPPLREQTPDADARAALALAVLAVDPTGLGGAVVRARGAEAGDWADAFCKLLRQLSESMPVARLPLSARAEDLSGGLDIAATLAARAPRVALGLLPRTDGGVVVVPCAERLSSPVLSELGDALDQGSVRVARDGLDIKTPARIALLALDGGDGEETCATALTERLAIHLQPTSLPPPLEPGMAARIVAARRRLGQVRLTPEALNAICTTAELLGEPSLRAARFCARVAAILAALGGRRVANDEDVAQAAVLVLAPRARRLPAAAEAQPPSPPPEANPQPAGEPSLPNTSPSVGEHDGTPQNLEDITIAAVRAALPSGVFDRVDTIQGRSCEGGRKAARRGRNEAGRGAPAGVRRAGRGARRFALAETLKAAAPWQTLRQAPPLREVRGAEGPAIRVAASDLRVRARRPRPRTAVTLVVDASGSAAIQRLAEAKGAVEHLLDRCYARRDEVALLTFRGPGAQVAMPPTRSLTRVRRRLGELAAGGATPLASALEAGARTATASRDRGATPLLVVLTDGRANMTRTGVQGRKAGYEDAMDAARGVGAKRLASVFIDISPRGEDQARDIAKAMGARYLRLPHVEAQALARAVRSAASASLRAVP